MGKTVLAVLAVLMFALPVMAQAPSAAGMYSQSESGYTRMELATSSGFKTHGA